MTASVQQRAGVVSTFKERKKMNDTKNKDCPATMESSVYDGHVHTCVGRHDEGGYHFCGVCRRWWWSS